MESINIKTEDAKFGIFSKSKFSDLSSIEGGCQTTTARNRTTRTCLGDSDSGPDGSQDDEL